MPQSIPYRLSQAVVAALRAHFEPLGAAVRDNPTSRAALNDGARVVFIEDVSDSPGDQPGGAEGRTFRFSVGVIARTEDARAQADTDAIDAKAIVKPATFPALEAMSKAGEVVSYQAPREMARLYRLEGIDVGGSLVLTAFEISYRTPSSQRKLK